MCSTSHVKWKRIETQDWKIKNKCLKYVDFFFHIKFKYLFWYKFMTTSTALNMFDTIYKNSQSLSLTRFFLLKDEWINQKLISLFIFISHILCSVHERRVTKFWRYLHCYWHLCISWMTLHENILGNFITYHTSKFRGCWKYWKIDFLFMRIELFFGVGGRSCFEEIEFSRTKLDRLIFMNCTYVKGIIQ